MFLLFKLTMNRQFCNFIRSWNFRIPIFFKSPLTGSLRFLKQIFLIARFCRTWIEFWFAKLVCYHNYDSKSRLDPNKEWYTIFKMIRFALCLILQEIPMVRFSLIFTWAVWLFHWRCSSFPIKFKFEAVTYACHISVKDN